MAAEHEDTGTFRGASFTGGDFTGATFRDCDLHQVKITDSWLIDVRMSGAIGSFVVNDVDVTAFVESELDRRHPERVLVRAMETADDYRSMWETLQRLWSQTLDRAANRPSAARDERVDDEWSLAETLRHLVFATDAWAGRAILAEPAPYHRLGLPHSSYPPADAAALGVDVAAQPSFDEVMEARASRVALVRGILSGMDDDALSRIAAHLPAPGYPEQERTVGYCLRVIMKEECEHRRYMERDLAVIEARQDPA